ncbi:hypothetical protein BLA29_012054, partial [Euroglyphus maynei]
MAQLPTIPQLSQEQQQLFRQVFTMLQNMNTSTQPSYVNTTTSQTNSFSLFPSTIELVQLPPIDSRNVYHPKNIEFVPEFDGRPANFKEFIDLFNAYIGTTNIVDMLKRTMLYSKLNDYGKNLIMGIEDYREAYSILINHYCHP